VNVSRPEARPGRGAPSLDRWACRSDAARRRRCFDAPRCLLRTASYRQASIIKVSRPFSGWGPFPWRFVSGSICAHSGIPPSQAGPPKRVHHSGPPNTGLSGKAPSVRLRGPLSVPILCSAAGGCASCLTYPSRCAFPVDSHLGPLPTKATSAPTRSTPTREGRPQWPGHDDPDGQCLGE
jgi:hypothetical protein